VRHGHEAVLFDLRPPGPAGVAPGTASGIVTVRGDARDVTAVLGALRAHDADAVVHTAGLLGTKANRNPFLAFQANAVASAAVAEAARLAGIGRLVHMSSLAVYDWPAAAGAASVPEDFPTAARNPYAASKLAGEAAVRCCAGADAAVLRLAGVYGPGRFAGGATMGAALQRVVRAALAAMPVAVPAALAGHEYLHAADAATAVRLVLERGLRGVYNVGTGRTYDAPDVAASLRTAVPGVPVDSVPAAPTAPPHLAVDRIRRDIPEWRCRPLDIGLTHLAEMLTKDKTEEFP
jgi:nucleoside-diphosphate-sugar epimerase